MQARGSHPPVRFTLPAWTGLLAGPRNLGDSWRRHCPGAWPSTRTPTSRPKVPPPTEPHGAVPTRARSAPKARAAMSMPVTTGRRQRHAVTPSGRIAAVPPPGTWPSGPLRWLGFSSRPAGAACPIAATPRRTGLGLTPRPRLHPIRNRSDARAAASWPARHDVSGGPRSGRTDD